jgi:hypothetical protein
MARIDRHSSLGATDGDPIAEVTVRFYASTAPDRAVRGYEIVRSVDERFDGRLDATRYAIKVLLDEMQGETSVR